ncbi:hypothetical protein TRVA0_004S00562 [Trichomonascus vanleenenianus]|uniref:uncharacterized protein n=1 Tax=Trichomonascus vanleenenianus TaxID=2268995 RepID=UPI003EC9A5E9
MRASFRWVPSHKASFIYWTDPPPFPLTLHLRLQMTSNLSQQFEDLALRYYITDNINPNIESPSYASTSSFHEPSPNSPEQRFIQPQMLQKHSEDAMFLTMNDIQQNPQFMDFQPVTMPTMLPLTVSPRDAMMKSPQDEYYARMYNQMPSLFDHDSPQFVPSRDDMWMGEEPEAMDEDDDDDDDDDEDESMRTDDNEYDDILFSSEEDDDEEDDLYDTLPTTHVPPLPQKSVSRPVEQPVSSSFEGRAPSAKSQSEDMFTPAAPGRPRKKTSVSHAGPHRCDLILPSTGKQCNKVFSRPYDLIRHQDTIHAPVRKTFKCDQCGDTSKTFSRMDALARHKRVKHPK